MSFQITGEKLRNALPRFTVAHTQSARLRFMSEIDYTIVLVLAFRENNSRPSTGKARKADDSISKLSTPW
jgi:hypothetical protein